MLVRIRKENPMSLKLTVIMKMRSFYTHLSPWCKRMLQSATHSPYTVCNNGIWVTKCTTQVQAESLLMTHPRKNVESEIQLTNFCTTPALNCFWLYSTLLVPAPGLGVWSLVNSKTLLTLRSVLWPDALPATTIDFSGIQIPDSLGTNRVF